MDALSTKSFPGSVGEVDKEIFKFSFTNLYTPHYVHVYTIKTDFDIKSVE